jgi:hypothetical protein
VKCLKEIPCTATLNKQKYHVLKNKVREQEGRIGPLWGIGTPGSGEDVGKGYRRENMVQILDIHVCKWKMRPVETILGGIKENDGGGEFSNNIFDIL